MVKDTQEVTGRIRIYENDSLVLDEKNIVTTLGKSLYASILAGTGTIPSHLGVDTSATVYTAGSTVLTTEVIRKGINLINTAANQVNFEFIILPGEAVGAWNGIGLFNAATAGTMSNVHNLAYTHNTADAIKIIWSVIIN